MQKNWSVVGALTVVSLLISGFGAPSYAEVAKTTVIGQVIDVNGNPVSTTVTLDVLQNDSTFSVLGSTTTQSDGFFTFLNVATDGKYQVSTKPSPTPNLTTAGRKAIMHSPVFTVDESGTIFDDTQTPFDLSITQVGVVQLPVTVTSSDATPIAGAIAVLTKQECLATSVVSPTPAATATANASGQLNFYAPESGKYCLQVSDPSGFNTSTSDSFTVTIPADGSDATSEALGDYILEPAGNVKVTAVSLATGKVISGAVVTATYGDPEALESRKATANSLGVAILKGLPDQSTVAITVSGPAGSSYIDNTTTATVIAGDTVLCDPPSNGDTEGVVPLDAGYPISGTVRDGSGTLLQNINVNVQSVDEAGEETPVTTIQTNAQGFYTTNGLATGTYNIHFSDTTSSLSQYRENADLNGLVMAEKALTNQNVVLRDCGVISGSVTDENGAPVGSALVSLRDAFGVEAGSAQEVDLETAAFTFTKVLPGKYSIKIVAAGYRDKFISNVVVASKQDSVIAEADAQLVSGSGISGRVIDTNAVPIINAQVAIYSATGNGLLPLSTTSTNTEGSYGFTNLPPGTYRLKFISNSDTVPSFDDFWFNDSESNASSFATAADITTEVGVVATDVNPVPVTPWANVTGFLTNGFDDLQEPVALEGASVQLVSLRDEVVESALTDSTGAYSLFAPTGDYRVRIDASGFSNTFLGLDSEGNGTPTLVAGDALIVHFEGGQVHFTGSEPATTQALPSLDLAQGGGTLSVSILEGTTAVTEGTVTVYDATGEQVAWADVTNESDAFVITGLAQGMKSATYRVSYELDGQYSKVYYGQTTSLNAAGTKSVVITTGKTTAIRISAVPLPSLDLELKSSASTSYSKGVTVEVYEFDAKEWILNSILTTQGAINPTNKVLSIKVSAGGQYRVRVVPDESKIAAVWLGTKPNALSVDQATTLSIPATGSLPKQTVLLNTPAIDVNAILTNDFSVDSIPTDIRQVVVTLTGNIGGDEVVLSSKQIPAMGAGEVITVGFDHIPTAYFPLTINATSADSVASPETVTAEDLADANSNQFDYIEKEISFSAGVEVATLSGTLLDTDGMAIADTVINLLTDDGEVALTQHPMPMACIHLQMFRSVSISRLQLRTPLSISRPWTTLAS